MTLSFNNPLWTLEAPDAPDAPDTFRRRKPTIRRTFRRMKPTFSRRKPPETLIRRKQNKKQKTHHRQLSTSNYLNSHSWLVSHQRSSWNQTKSHSWVNLSILGLSLWKEQRRLKIIRLSSKPSPDGENNRKRNLECQSLRPILKPANQKIALSNTAWHMVMNWLKSS